MRIYIVGIACVGKSTIGEQLAQRLDYKFIDFDKEVEERMGEHITSIKNRTFTEYGYREEVKHILEDLLVENEDHVVIAMPPVGLLEQYSNIIKKYPDIITVALKDKAKNILERLTFFDDESKPIYNVVNDRNRHLYYREIQKDIEYFGQAYKKAKISFFMNGMNIEDTTAKLLDLIREYEEKELHE